MMELNRVEQFMHELDGRPIGERLNRVEQAERDLIQATPTLDTLTVRVSIDKGSTETWTEVANHEVREGNLLVSKQGEDTSGLWITTQSIIYAPGVWRVAEASQDTTPNPYYIEPEPPDGAAPGQDAGGVTDPHTGGGLD